MAWSQFQHPTDRKLTQNFPQISGRKAQQLNKVRNNLFCCFIYDIYMLFQATVQEELKRRFITAIKALKYLSIAYTLSRDQIIKMLKFLKLLR